VSHLSWSNLSLARGFDLGRQPAFRVGTTKGTLTVSDRSKLYRMLLKMPRKFLTILSLQICQGSGVGSIPIGRSFAHPAGMSVLRMSLLNFPQPREFRVIFVPKYR